MDTENIADALWDAMQEGRYMPPEWAGRFELEQGYAIQLSLLRRRLTNGERQSGWKVGLTAAAMRTQQRVHEPCFGYLLESARHVSGHIYRLDQLIAPGFENELCLTLGETLTGPGVTLADALRAVSHAAPALEIVEVRGPFADNLPLAMADNAQQKAYVLGTDVALTPDNCDLARATVSVKVGDLPADSALGSAVMDGGGLLSVVWLANKLAQFGVALEAGTQVMSGSFTRQYSVAGATRVATHFDPFGTVEAHFI